MRPGYSLTPFRAPRAIGAWQMELCFRLKYLTFYVLTDIE